MNKFEQLLAQGKLSQLQDEVDNLEDGPQKLYWTLLIKFHFAKLGANQEYVDEIYDGIENYSETWQLKIKRLIAQYKFTFGDYNTAYSLIEEVLDNVEPSNDELAYGESLAIKGAVHGVRYEFEKSKQFMQESLKYLDGNPMWKTNVLGNIGTIFWFQNKHQPAIKSHKEALRLKKELGNPLSIGYSLYPLLMINLELGNRGKSNTYLSEFKKLSDKYDSLLLDQGYKLSKAIYLKSSKRNKEKVQAQIILEDLLDEKQMDFQIKSQATYHLVELLIFEYKAYGEEQVLKEIEGYIDDLLVQAKVQDMDNVQVEVLILLSRLRIIQKKYDEAVQILNEAEQLSRDNKIDVLIEEISEERKRLEQHIHSIKTEIETSSISDDIEKSMILEYIQKMKKLK